MLKSVNSQRLVAWFLLAWSLLNFPLLALWDHSVQFLGLPLFPLGLFAVWAVIIAGLAFIIELGGDGED